MRNRVVAIMCSALVGSILVACGTKKEDDEDANDSPTPPASAGYTPRDGGGVADGVPVSQGQPGKNGAPGAPGSTGSQGQPGAQGPRGPEGETGGYGGLILFDANDEQIGIPLRDDDGTVAHVVLSDRKYAMIDRDTGDLVPLLDFFCLYETNDCTGSCYAYDKRWLNLVMRDHVGGTWVASRRATDLGPKLMGSYVTTGGMCEVNAIGTTESYLAEAYDLPADLELPLSAPLYWDMAH